MSVDEPGTFAHDPNSQYDPDSFPNGTVNCGPTTVTNSLRFHTGRDYPINETRRLAKTTNGTGTNLAERKKMFERRGVPAEILHLSYAAMKKHLDGTRTFDLPLLMSKIPLSVRRRPFGGTHSVEALSSAVVNGVPGVYVNNPDYHRDRDGEYSRTFIPDVYLRPAYEALGSWICSPSKPRVVATRRAYKKKCRSTASVNLRSGPGTKYSVVRLVPSGYAFTSIQVETAGGSYVAGGKTRRDWLSLNYNGRLVWVARGFVKET